MKDNRTRLFEVMGRLDKTFTAPKTKLNEEFEPASPVAFKQPMGGGMDSSEMGGEEEKVEQTPEEKLEALTAKVDELYALLHGEEEEPESEEGEGEGVENLQEWNFDKKKGEKNDDDDDDKHEKGESEKEEKAEHEKGGEEFGKKDESIESPAKPKVPVNMIAKVGK